MSYNLGKILIKKKYFSKALLNFQQILKNKPNDLRANFQMGKAYYELNNLKKSIIFFQKCDEIQPKTPNVLFNLALALQGIGEIQEAKNKYLDLISINPKDIKSYYGLYSLNIDNITPKLYEKIKKINEENKISPFEKSLINFIFSKIEKKKKNFKSEIEYLKISQELCYKSNLILNKQADFYYKNIITNYSNAIKFKKKFTKIPKINNSKHLFIVGLPRSGSSLVETIICHNSNDIYSVGEFHGINTSILNQVGEIIYSKNFDYKKYQIEIDQEEFQQSLIEKYGNLEKNIFLDKSLENFFNIEIILQFFPNAKFLHTFRNYKDAIIGIYQTMLPGLSWSHKIMDIINYINLYEKTIRYFKKKYPDKIIDINLHKLTSEKEREAKKILDFCGIKPREDFLDFDKNTKLFNKTNSFLQVRKKIKKYDDNKYEPYYFLLKNLNYE